MTSYTLADGTVLIPRIFATFDFNQMNRWEFTPIEHKELTRFIRVFGRQHGDSFAESPVEYGGARKPCYYLYDDCEALYFLLLTGYLQYAGGEPMEARYSIWRLEKQKINKKCSLRVERPGMEWAGGFRTSITSDCYFVTWDGNLDSNIELIDRNLSVKEICGRRRGY